MMNDQSPFSVFVGVDVSKDASSAESVGEKWLGKFAEAVKQGDFNALFGAKAIGLSDRQFGFVVEALHNARGYGPFSAEPVQQQVFVFAQRAGHFFERPDLGTSRRAGTRGRNSTRDNRADGASTTCGCHGELNSPGQSYLSPSLNARAMP